ncbi:amino acid adenylation domain-containing protein [Kutzneria kofuensis]|uniref:Amino acid adenylation domain-containing protein n=1 Tax=Kutzneria kofuensis TaxID=103725 RepID=A0A7W9KCW8_9PSEU|nr:amino acid adenylation domain-containing protein [Kutzneria kofuensis]MBB5889863.1 amino acid adenylation domain-containing protein [Kutzneria kofuensis]
MATPTESGREHWRGVLLAGGSTTIPRWTRTPVPGAAELDSAIPEDVTAALGRLADQLAVPVSSVQLAAHAKVLAALCGERAVVTGYVATPGGPPLPCRLAIGRETWRALLRDVRRVESDLLAYKDFPVEECARELGVTEQPFEVVFDPTGDGDLTGRTVLRVGVVRTDERVVLRLRYRTDVLDADCAARIAGYHRTALMLLAADPDAEHGPQSLLSAEEFRFQLDELAGPHRTLPDRRFHELFERRVRMHPDAVAVVHGDRRLTYRELNARANRLARALQARELRREDAVAVVTERNLDWAAAVVAVFKAGGVYVPIEPQLPADRVTAMLRRAGCRLVLTELGSTRALDQDLDTLSRVELIFIDAACGQPYADGDLGVHVGPEQLAHIYFTADSTGEPTGAMGEHAGMLNHLYAKIDDLGLAAGHVVAQTAPQGFDLSLWQLLSALLVGGRTLLVEPAAIADVERFVDTIVRGRVTVFQVAPSYLDAVLAWLEHTPRRLPDLRFVSVTGEELRPDLARRWFAAQPGIGLVNAYGTAETSGATHHEVMTAPPAGDRVPLGRCVNNVRAYVVDEHLVPVPLGAPGAIVFSGVCVGRGYVDDAERTRSAFMTDPHREGERLYRGGDHGRWRLDGKLELLGPRDCQAEIPGCRGEIGEVDTALSRAPAAGPDRDPPSTPTEHRLAVAWAKALGLRADRIGRHDHFFDRGGTSLSAVRLVIGLDRAVSLRDVTRHPVLADLARLLACHE